MSSLPSNSFHNKKELPLDLMACHIGSAWREFAKELSPIVTSIFNLSIKSQTVPCFWKLANISPVPKETPLSSLNQLRPVSVTDIIIRLLEKIIYVADVKPVIRSYVSLDQFVYRESTNTSQALIN